MNPKVIVNIPATSANMGPGLDCLGIALDVWNTGKVFDGNSSVDVNGYGEEVLPRDETNLVYKGFAEFFRVIEQVVPPVKLVCENNIKLARGMGSSSAALVGGLFAANSYAGALGYDYEPVKPGILRREEGDALIDQRVMDGFNVKFYGNMMCLSYQAEVQLKEV